MDKENPYRAIICDITIQVIIENLFFGFAFLAIILYSVIQTYRKNLLRDFYGNGS